jgi:hypothetical protein
MGGKKAVATSQCRLVVVNGMPSMNRPPMNHHGRLATGLTVWSRGSDSPGVSLSSSSIGMIRTLGSSPDVGIPRLYNVYLEDARIGSGRFPFSVSRPHSIDQGWRRFLTVNCEP